MKKKVVFMLILAAVVLYAPAVFAAKNNIASCDSVISNSVLIDKKIPEVISLVVTAIKIAVPVLLVIFGSIDLIKGMTAQKEDEIKKGQQIFVKRLIAGALVFFVFTIVQFIISLAAGNGNTNIMTCANCFINNNCTYR